MKRRLKILLVTFGVILSAFVLYYLVSDEDIPSPWRRTDSSTMPAAGKSASIPGGGEIGPVTGVVIYQYDKRHRLQAKYTASKSEKVGEKLYLTSPKVKWYLRDGETIIIQAQHGIITADEAAGKWNIRSGLLRDEDKIRITIDRNRDADPDRSPLEQRPDDEVEILVDEEVCFDNDLLTIKSDGGVSVVSKEADIFGRGLRIAWSEEPRQLRELRIIQGDRMVIREGQDQFIAKMSLPSGAESDKDAPEKPEKTSSRPSADTKPSVARVETPTTMPTTASATMPTTALATVPATAPATMPTTIPAGPAPIMPDTYVVTLSDNVLVTSGDREMKGADELRMVLEFKSPSRREREDSARPTRPAEKTAASKPVTGIPASKPTGIKTATTKPVDEMVITWTGPLVIKPFKSHEKPIPERFDVTATGKTLVLSDSKSRAVCRRLEFRSPGRGGVLLGTPDEPVKLTMASGERITVPRVRFNSDTGVVNLEGAGEMHLPENAAASLNLTGTDDEEQPDKKKREKVTITWTEKVEAAMGRREVKTETGVENEDFLRWAVFTGDVDVQQGKTQNMKADELTVKFHHPAPADEKVNRIASLHASGSVNMNDTESGEFIKSRKLDVQMSGPQEEEVYPRQAVATGEVSAMQEEMEITDGEKLTITFARKPDKKTGKIKLSARTATLEGKPATVKQKDNIIRGEKIIFDQAKESASVVGAGNLRFHTDRDINGNKLDKPRPMDIAWDEKMDHRGKERTAIIVGAVHLEIAGDELRCEKMTVVFAEPEDDASTRPTAKTKPAGFANFRSQKIETVTAEKNVRLESQRHDKDGFLLQRMQLTSEEVIYKVDLGVLECSQAGTLSAEDYRPPEKKKVGQRRDDLTGNIDRPSQSAFKWSDSMKMNQTIRTVWMAGKVRMVHRSGANVVLAKKLNVRPWDKLPEGRKTQLDCEKIKTRFAAPEEKTDEKDASPRSGPRVGSLDLFDATGDVNLEDGPRQVFCRRILYQREPADTAIIWGSLPGEPIKNAVMYYRDATRGILNSWKSPQLIWHRRNNRVEARGADVRGGR